MTDSVASPLFMLPPTIDPADYLPAEDVDKVASIRMTMPPNQWPDEIRQAIVRTHPFIPMDRLIVTITRADEPSGYATGYAAVEDAPRVSIPFVVAQRQLKPLDLMIMRAKPDEEGRPSQDDEVMPLNEDTYIRATEMGDVGEVVPPTVNRGVAWTEDGTSLRLPYRGRTVLASVMGANEERKEAFQTILAEEREALAGLVHHNEAILQAWIEAPEPAQTIQQKMAEQQVELTEASILTALPDTVPALPEMGARVFLADGTSKIAAVVPCVDLSSPLDPHQVLVFEDGSYCQAPDTLVIGSSMAESDDMAQHVMAKTASHGLKTGETVCFFLHDHFTAPLKIASIQVNEHHNYIQLRLADGVGNTFPLVLTDTVKEAMLSDQGGWAVPLDGPVMRLGDYVDPYRAPITEAKAASHLSALMPDSLTCARGERFTLQIRDHDLGVQDVPQAKCAEVLRRWFSNADVLVHMAKEASANAKDGIGVIRFSSQLDQVVDDVEAKIASFKAYPEAARELLDCAMDLRKAVKLAASLGLPDGADAVLGLGFLSEDNLAEFAGFAEELQETVHKLARLLLYIRMGLPEGDENATMVALRSLQRVADRLQALGSVAGGAPSAGRQSPMTL